MGEALTVQELATKAAGLSAQAFTAELGPWVLIGPPAESKMPDKWSYATQHAMPALTSNPFGPIATNIVFPLRARDRRAAVGTSILIGRTDSNDVCISDPSISKLHARVTKTDFALSDAGSTNGTFVNGRKLGPSESIPLKANMLLRFGDRAFQVHAAEALHTTLQGLARRP